MKLILVLLASFILTWNAPRETEYFTLRVSDTLDYTVWDHPRVCTYERPCDSISYTPQTGIVEQVYVVAHRGSEAISSPTAWTMLALDWSQGNDTPSTYYGSGSMGCTQVRVLLPSPRWSVLYSFQGAVPVYVRATCDSDYTGDGIVNLSDLPPWATWWLSIGRPLPELAYFGKDYQSHEQEWRE